MTYLLLVILALTVLTAFLPGKDLLSPSRIYISVYSLLLSIYCLKLSRIQTPWSLSTICLFWGATVLFLAGGFWIWLTVRAKHPGWALDFRELRGRLAVDAASMDWDWFAKVWLACVAVFTASFAVSWLMVGDIPIFMPNPDKARIDFLTATMPTSYGMFMGPLSLMLGAELLWFSGAAGRGKLLVAGGVLLVFLLYMTVVSRYEIFRVLIFSMVLYHYGRRRLGMAHLAVGLALASSFFLVGFLVRVNVDTIGAFNEMIKVKLPQRYAWASNFYAYLANDFWNLDFAMQKYVDGTDHYPFQWGMGLFRALLWNLRIEGQLVASYGFDSIYNESATKVEGLNTVIYVWHLYKDFGFAGALLLVFAAGLLVWKFYSNLLLRPTLFHLSVWGILAGMIALSYHTPLWELWFVYLNLIVIAVAHRRLKLL